MAKIHETYSFDDWDQEHFRRAGEILTALVERRQAVTDGRAAILALYFQDNPELGEQDAA